MSASDDHLRLTLTRILSHRISRNLAAGLFLVAIAAIALWRGSDLTLGNLSHFGPGMLPFGLAILSAALGLIIALRAFWEESPELGRWSWRNLLFLLGGALSFGLCIRPLGLILAAPCAVILSSLADHEARLREIVIFALFLTGFCILLFRYILGLPIPVAPWLIGY